MQAGDTQEKQQTVTRYGPAGPHEPLLGIWKSEQDSNTLRAFMAALKLHSAHWHWVSDPGSARWWVIDDVSDTHGHDAATAIYRSLPRKPHVVFLSRQLVRLPVPSWTFFKMPLETQQLFKWLDAQFRTMAPEPGNAQSQVDWTGSMIVLTRWPNMARYGKQLELILACSKLLADWTAYDELIRSVGDSRQQLDALLLEARNNGTLRQMRHRPAASRAAPPPPTGRPNAAATAIEHRRVGLIRRLLDRFSFK